MTRPGVASRSYGHDSKHRPQRHLYSPQEFELSPLRHTPPATMSRNPETQPRKVRRFLPQLIETCSRKVGGLRIDTGDIGISETKTPSHPCTKNGPPIPSEPGSKLSEGLERPFPRSHLKRQRGSENYDPIGRDPLRGTFPENPGTIGIDKEPAASGLEASHGGEDPIQHKALPHRPRRFTPQVIETGKRSFRRGEPELSPHQSNPQEHHQTHPGGITGRAVKQPVGIDSESVPESRFSYASLVQRQGQPRRRSFRVPDLPPIPSPWDEGSESEAARPSHVTASSLEPPAESLESPSIISQRREYRESCDESQARYLLSLAARSAEEQLKERALEAFPNEQVYEPVDHFAIDSEEDEESVEEREHIKHRRTSSADLMWALQYMRLHKEEAEIKNRAMVGIYNFQDDPTATIMHDALYRDGPLPDYDLLSDTRRDAKAAYTGRRARPPMLGGDLVFPQSVSPVGTLHSIPASPQKEKDEHCEVNGGLWCGNSRGGSSVGEGGLWMGTCKPPDENHVGFQQGPAEASPISEGPGSANGHAEEDIERRRRLREVSKNEFDDAFVTQIYNYLSLGYPCVARYFDYELSEVSGIPIKKLRQDDLHTDAKGYAGIARGSANGADSDPRKCMRWVALRSYIDKYAKDEQDQQQQSEMDEGAASIEAWGVPERKGSWAF